MHKTTSISGGKTSAFVAANFPTEHNWFALVSTNDPSCKFKDDAMAHFVKQKTGKDIIGTLEMDEIIYTIMDLEQFTGRAIDVVVGNTFEKVIENASGYLPNVVKRFCTSEMKLRPLFEHWQHNFDDPIEVQIGFRANERRRAENMMAKTNEYGLTTFRTQNGHLPDGRKRWHEVAWQKPVFPLIEHNIFKDQIEKFWQGKKVRFARMNNCVGCFHRNPILLRQMAEHEPTKMNWFAKQERKSKKGRWRKDMTYDDIMKHKLQLALDVDEWVDDCDAGTCGL